MPAGTWLDLVIAELLGAEVCMARLRTDTNRFAEPLWCRRCQEDAVGQRLSGEHHKPPRPYSTDPAAAWAVVEEMHRRGLEPGISSWPPPWECAWKDRRSGSRIWLYADTAPLAICRAALRALTTEAA
jgi:hypothetical protein